MASTSVGTARLATYLRELRKHEWPEAELTQRTLAKAFSAEKPVAPATLSSWESVTAAKLPPRSRLNAYARFFATRRSLVPEPHLIPLDDLTDDELERFHELETKLIGYLD